MVHLKLFDLRASSIARGPGLTVQLVWAPLVGTQVRHVLYQMRAVLILTNG